MKALRRRLERAAPRVRADRFEIWDQAIDGTDRFTSTVFPDVVLTAAELDARPVPPGWNRITVVRVETPIPDRTPPGKRV